MNVYLNNYCNQRCPYCFAADLMDRPRQDLGFLDFAKILTFLERCAFPTLRLEGGEPTLHPQFTRFVSHALQRGFRVRLFTNGLFGEPVRELLARERERIACTWNVNMPASYGAGAWARLEQNLAAVVPGSVGHALGVNVYEVDQPLDYLLELCRRYRPHRLRYVFVHQPGGPQTVRTIPPADYPRITARIASLTRQAADELGLGTLFDCGFTPCSWTDEELATLARCATHANGCHICPGVGPDLLVSHCFHTFVPEDRAPLDDFADLAGVNAFCEGVKRRYEHLLLFDHCRDCTSRRLGACDGGCLGDRLWRAQGSS